MQAIIIILVLIVIGIFWLVSTINEKAQASKKRKESLDKLDEKYKDRLIDKTKTLEERNIDIIQNHIKKLSTGFHRSYYIENSVRDCIQEIAEAERELSIAPNYSYLSTWQTSAPPLWLELKDALIKLFRGRHEQLEKEQATRVKKE